MKKIHIFLSTILLMSGAFFPAIAMDSEEINPSGLRVFRHGKELTFNDEQMDQLSQFIDKLSRRSNPSTRSKKKYLAGKISFKTPSGQMAGIFVSRIMLMSDIFDEIRKQFNVPADKRIELGIDGEFAFSDAVFNQLAADYGLPRQTNSIQVIF